VFVDGVPRTRVRLIPIRELPPARGALPER
jgi:hypothetical protein